MDSFNNNEFDINDSEPKNEKPAQPDTTPGFENSVEPEKNFRTEKSYESEVQSTLRSSQFYTESYKKPAKKHMNIFQLLLVAIVGAVLGGFVVGGFFYFLAPAIQPAVGGYFNSVLTSKTAAGSTNLANTNQNLYKKVEIIQNSDTPVTAIAEKVGPSVVGIRVTATQQDIFFGQQQAQGEGSGIIIRSDGYIVTNNHVVTEAVNPNTKKFDSNSKVEVFLPSQPTKPYKATLVGTDSRTDLAVIKIDATNLPAAELGDSDQLKPGELAVAIGNPGGLEFAGSITAGIISGLNRTIQTEDGVTMKLIQTDAAINPGNSGGALTNSKGQVIGINNMKIAANGFEGLGFAIPINLAKQVTDDLINNRYVKGRPFLGISTDPRYTPDVAKANNMPSGVYVADVTMLSGAQKAGIQKGDVITKFDGQPVTDVNGLNDIKNTHKVGDTVKVEIYRNGATKTLTVTLTEDKGDLN